VECHLVEWDLWEDLWDKMVKDPPTKEIIEERIISIKDLNKIEDKLKHLLKNQPPLLPKDQSKK